MPSNCLAFCMQYNGILNTCSNKIQTCTNKVTSFTKTSNYSSDHLHILLSIYESKFTYFQCLLQTCTRMMLTHAFLLIVTWAYAEGMNFNII